MLLDEISILNYRNIADCNLRFSPKINCFLGNNGMGKTNLLDAVYYLSFLKSHLNPIDSQVIRHDANIMMIKGIYERSGEKEIITCSYKKQSRKTIKRNDKAYVKFSEHIGFIPLVTVSPDDLSLISEGSDERRRFLDVVISQYDKPYLQALIRYNRALQNRNALMKSEVEPDVAMLDIYEEQMAEDAVYIFEKRNAFVDGFTPVFQHFYQIISENNEQVSLKYISHLQKGDLQELLRQVRIRDRAVGYTTRGIHRDDLEMSLDGYLIRRTGSQGQNKSFLVSLKLAQFVFLKDMGEVTPLLLLDDLFDKLDARRVTNIMKLVASKDFGQIFITDTNREHLDEVLNRIDGNSKSFEVKNGEIKEWIS